MDRVFQGGVLYHNNLFTPDKSHLNDALAESATSHDLDDNTFFTCTKF